MFEGFNPRRWRYFVGVRRRRWIEQKIITCRDAYVSFVIHISVEEQISGNSRELSDNRFVITRAHN